MFRTLPAVNDESPNLSAYTRALRSMVPTMRALFAHVEALVRLLTVNPASSATAERSFSSLRRLKTLAIHLWTATAEFSRRLSRTQRRA